MRLDLLGCTLLCISAFLYAVRYIAAALYVGPGSKSWSSRLFSSSYEYVGTGLTRWAVISLLLAIVCFIVCLGRLWLQKVEGKVEAQIEGEVRGILSAAQQAAHKKNEE